MNRQLLEQPFNQDQIKQRQGSFGNTLDYVEAHMVIQRLNEAFDSLWSFQVESHEVLESEVIVLGRLTAEGITKSQFGSSTVTRARDTGELVSLAADMKAAATDSLKKCATLLGVGLHLYGTHKAPSEPRQPVPFRNQGHTAHGEQIPANDNTRLTNKQLNYIVNLGSEIGMDSKSLDVASLEEFGVKMAYLTKRDASAFIDSLKRKAA
jgi:hypothetical protein